MTRHIHADHMIAAANDTGIEWEYFDRRDGTWTACGLVPCWDMGTDYRQKPAPHPHQALMDMAAADPSIKWQMQIPNDGSWGDCDEETGPVWLENFKYRPKPAAPKMVDMYQWALKSLDNGHIYVGSGFYESEPDANLKGYVLVCRIEGSKISVEVPV